VTGKLRSTTTAAAVGLGLVAGLAGCGGREHSNPFDPANPETRGTPDALEAQAGCELVDLTWSDLGIEDIRGFRIWRERLEPQPVGPAQLTGEPLSASARGYTDGSVANGALYAYTLEFLFTPGSSAPTRAARARPGPGLPWIADPCGYGLALLSPDGRALRRRIDDGAAVLALDIDEATHRLYAAEINAGIVLVASTADGARLRELPAPGASCLDWNPRVGLLAVGAFYEQTLSWLLPSGDTIASVALGGHPEDVALRDSATTWVALYEGRVLRAEWDALAGGRIEVVADSLARAVRVLDDPAGPGCWVADRAGRQVVYVTDDGAIVRTAPGLLGEPLDLAVAGQGGCWVADRSGQAVVRIDRTCALLERRPELGRVAGIREDPQSGALWVTVPEAAVPDGSWETGRAAAAGLDQRASPRPGRPWSRRWPTHSRNRQPTSSSWSWAISRKLTGCDALPKQPQWMSMPRKIAWKTAKTKNASIPASRSTPPRHSTPVSMASAATISTAGRVIPVTVATGGGTSR
jgi:hypothetical protein